MCQLRDLREDVLGGLQGDVLLNEYTAASIDLDEYRQRFDILWPPR